MNYYNSSICLYHAIPGDNNYETGSAKKIVPNMGLYYTVSGENNITKNAKRVLGQIQ